MHVHTRSSSYGEVCCDAHGNNHKHGWAVAHKPISPAIKAWKQLRDRRHSVDGFTDRQAERERERERERCKDETRKETHTLTGGQRTQSQCHRISEMTWHMELTSVQKRPALQLNAYTADKRWNYLCVKDVGLLYIHFIVNSLYDHKDHHESWKSENKRPRWLHGQMLPVPNADGLPRPAYISTVC